MSEANHPKTQGAEPVTGLKWQDPDGQPARPANPVVDQLRERPGQWALIAENAGVLDATVKGATLTAAGAECTTRPKGFLVVDLYARVPAETDGAE